jgi:hypothetical protein
LGNHNAMLYDLYACRLRLVRDGNDVLHHILDSVHRNLDLLVHSDNHGDADSAYYHSDYDSFAHYFDRY